MSIRFGGWRGTKLQILHFRGGILKPALKSRVVAAAIVVITAIAVTLLLALQIDDPLELPVRDLALRLLPSHSPTATVVVAIDERSLREIGPWPWPRPVLANIVDRVADAGAQAVIFDVLLAEARPGDQDLARAMHRVPTVAVAVLDERGEWLGPTTTIANAAIAAHGNFELDHDGILRRFATTKQSGNRSLTALALQAASLLNGVAVPIGRSIAPAFRVRPRSIPIVGTASLLQNPGLAASFREKLVFVGPTALALSDRVLTPVSAKHLPDPGVTVHAAATESIVRGEEVREIPPIFGGLLAAALVGSMLSLRRSSRARLFLASFLALAIVAGGVLLLATTGFAIPFVTLLLPVIALETALMAASLHQSRRAASRIESGLGIDMDQEEVGPRLEQIATRLAERRAQEVESKRVLAHELKTPLASMRGLTQLLGGFELTDAERRRVGSLLESEATKLQSMVQKLLDLERLPLRDFDASSTVVDLGDLVAGRVEFLRASTDRTLVTSISPGLLVLGDAVLIEHVIDNLVGNALKYAPAPSPVRIELRRASNAALLEVEDSGPGVAAADRVRIFHRFFRGSTAAGTEGLGLGLSLVAEVARWHGGEVSVDQGADGGSRFRFAVPLAPAMARARTM